MKKVLVIAGPTASGKSDFAVEVAKKVGGIIISGDSIQVYKGLDIGSGKVTEEEMQGVPHYLIDILDPKEPYSVAQFQKEARAVIDKSDALPIVCGGTGLYVKACIYDYVFSEEGEQSVDPALEQYSNEELYDRLQKADPQQALKIHPNNRRRVLRALTVIQQNQRPMSEMNEEQEHTPVYDAFIACTTMDREVLYSLINQRVENMFAQGLEKEIRGLLQKGITFKDGCMKGIGYKEWEPYFKQECTVEEVKLTIQKHSRQFAKKQFTWFRHQMDVHWFDPQNAEDRNRMIGEIEEWVNN